MSVVLLDGQAVTLDTLPDPAYLDARRLRRQIVGLLYAAGVPPATIAQTMRLSPRSVYYEIERLDSREAERLHDLAS